MTVFLLPLWLLSGSFFPAKGVPWWLAILMKVNPLTYGVSAMRQILYPGDRLQAADLPSLEISLAVTLAPICPRRFFAVMCCQWMIL